MTELTATDFEMKWDAEHTFPFFETENATIMAYGHHDPEKFVALVREYDDLCDPRYAETHSVADVQHIWATVEGSRDEEWVAHWGGVTAETPDAIPLTVIRR
jgi:hypothetical protein